MQNIAKQNYRRLVAFYGTRLAYSATLTSSHGAGAKQSTLTCNYRPTRISFIYSFTNSTQIWARCKKQSRIVKCWPRV